MVKEEQERGRRFMRFIDDSPEPFHVVETVSTFLKSQGFQALDESQVWRGYAALKRGGKYYYTRNRSSIVAFTVGEMYQPGNGFKIIGGGILGVPSEKSYTFVTSILL